MTLTPTRPAARRAPARPQTDWSLDLPVGGTRRPAPTQPAAGRTNVARLNGENIRYAGYDGYMTRWGVNMPYLQADLLDLTPQDPLSIWEFGTYKIKVHAGMIDLNKGDMDRMLQRQIWERGPNFPVSKAQVEFKSRERVKLKGQAKWKGIPVPFSVTARLQLTSSSSLAAKPTSVRLFGVPLLWAVKLFNIDLTSKLPLPQDGPATVDKHYNLSLDLAKTGLFEGELKALQFRKDGLAVKIGGERAPSLRGVRTDDIPNYCEVVADGEVALESAIIRNASVMIVDATPETPYAINKWDTEGHAKIEKGHVILDEARLRKKFMGATGAFRADSAKLVGADMVVEGKYNFLGINWPVDFKLRFSVKDGQLKMTPHGVRFVGFKVSASKMMDTLKSVAGAKQDGDGVLLDLRQAASVEMGRIKELKTEPGRLVLVRR